MQVFSLECLAVYSIPYVLSHSLTVMLQAVNQHKEECALSPAQLYELGDEISKDDDVIKKCSPQFITALW